MREKDHDRAVTGRAHRGGLVELIDRTQRLSNGVMLGTIGLAFAGLALLQLVGPNEGMNLVAAAACTGFGLIGPAVMSVYLARPSWKDRLPIVTAVIGVTQLVFIIGVVASTKGERGPLWIVFIPLAIITS